MEWAFTAPLLLKERLGGGPLDANAIAPDGPGRARGGLSGQARPAPLSRVRWPSAPRHSAPTWCEHYGGRAEAVWNDVPTGDELFAGSWRSPVSATAKARIFVGLLGKRLGVRPPGWETVAADWASIADVDSFERVAEIREQKRAKKAAAKQASAES